MSETMRNVQSSSVGQELSPRGRIAEAAHKVVLQSTCVNERLVDKIVDPATINGELVACLKDLVEDRTSWSETSLERFYRLVEATYMALGGVYFYTTDEEMDADTKEQLQKGDEKALKRAAGVVIEAALQFAPTIGDATRVHMVLGQYEGSDVQILGELFGALAGITTS